MTARLKALGGRGVIRTLATGDRQVLTVPLHKELATGTLHAIYRQALKFIPADELRPYFFHQ